MGKREDYVVQLRPLLAESGSDGKLESFLLAGSNLPGPRGNLELAAAFGDCCAEPGVAETRWDLLGKWTAISAAEAPADSAAVFLPFCALQALGAACLGLDAERRAAAVAALKAAAADSRWRVREAVAMGFQRIAESSVAAVEGVFAEWLPVASPIERRAIVAALAHPPVLGDPKHARFCLRVTEAILTDLLGLDADARKAEGFKVLRQGLEYAISVFVAALPDEGFALLLAWARRGDPDVSRIVRSNLGKARLAKPYPNQVSEVSKLL